MTRFEEGFS